MTPSQLTFRVWRFERRRGDGRLNRQRHPEIGKVCRRILLESRRRHADDVERRLLYAQFLPSASSRPPNARCQICMAEDRDRAALPLVFDLRSCGRPTGSTPRSEK